MGKKNQKKTSLLQLVKIICEGQAGQILGVPRHERENRERSEEIRFDPEQIGQGGVENNQPKERKTIRGMGWPNGPRPLSRRENRWASRDGRMWVESPPKGRRC